MNDARKWAWGVIGTLVAAGIIANIASAQNSRAEIATLQERTAGIAEMRRDVAAIREDVAALRAQMDHIERALAARGER